MSVAGLSGLYRRPFNIAAALFTLIVVGACGGGGDSGGSTNPGGGNSGGTKAITVSLSAATADVVQGATSNVTVNITRTGGFTGDVAIGVDGLPSGVTVNAATITSSQTSATLTFTAAAAAATGAASLTVRASGSGVTTVTTPLALTVRAAASPAGAFTLTATPATVSLAQGATSTVTIAIARTGSFTGPVALAVSGASTGLTATLSSASVSGTSATLTLAAASTLAVGTQTLTIRGTGTGAADQAVTVPVTITAASSGGSNGNVAWTFCGTSGLPIWLAAQDGTGAWTHITGTNDTYAFNIGARGGVAYVVQTGNSFDLEVIYGTGDELKARGTGLCNGAVGSGKTVTAPLANVGATDFVLASLGPSTASVTLTGSQVATFQNVPSGTLDLIASKSSLSISGGTPSFSLGKMLIRRGLNPAAGSALAPIDFGSSEAFDPVTKNLTIGNIGADVSLVSGAYFTSNNTFAPFLTDVTGVSGATRTYRGVPAANQAAGDLHLLTISAVPSLTQTTQIRNVTTAFKDAVDRTVTLGPALSTPTVTGLPATGYGRARAVITVQTEYNRYFSFDLQQSGAASRSVNVQQTSGYASGSTVTLDVPDLSGVAGFDVNWGLKVGTAATWTISASGWTGAGVVAAAFVDGATYFAATRQGSVTP